MIYTTGTFVNEILTASKKYIHNMKLCSFADLNTEERQGILLETFMRSWKTLWAEYNIESTPFKRDLTQNQEKGLFVFEMTLKNSTDAKVFLEFSFKTNSTFEVNPKVSAPSELLHAKYSKAVNEVLDAIRLKFKKHYSEKLFLQSWFDTLHIHKMSGLSGKEAIWIYKIHNNAVKYLPIYQKLPIQKQLNLLQAGAQKALHYRRDKRDIYTYAKFCYEEFKAAHVTKSFIGTNPITHVSTLYTQVVSYRSFGDYMYEVMGDTFRTSIHDYEVWNLLCTSSVLRFA